LRERSFDWLNANDGHLNMLSDTWNSDISEDDQNAQVANVDSEAEFSVMDIGPAAGSKGTELGLENPTTLHEFAAFGRGNRNDMGAIIVEVGYRKRI